MKARTAMYRNGDVTRKRIAFHFVKPGQKSFAEFAAAKKRPWISNFERLGWTRSTDEDFDVYWASVHSVRGLFNPDNLSKRLRDGQVVNHFPNHYELTRKDLMARNIKRYRRERERQEQLAVAEGMDLNLSRKKGQSEPNLASSFERVPLEWVPATYSLPNDYALFVEEFRKSPNSTWIAKPTGKAQGRGIFLVSKLNQLKRWSNPAQKEKNQQGQPLPFREPYIISRYISDPLLVGGKKFDMRLYVLVTNYKPLKAPVEPVGAFHVVRLRRKLLRLCCAPVKARC
eukprot:s931_g23.t1